jgi:hypothetical protein
LQSVGILHSDNDHVSWVAAESPLKRLPVRHHPLYDELPLRIVRILGLTFRQPTEILHHSGRVMFVQSPVVADIAFPQGLDDVLDALKRRAALMSDQTSLGADDVGAGNYDDISGCHYPKGVITDDWYYDEDPHNGSHSQHDGEYEL